jgi:hypothetical protein
LHNEPEKIDHNENVANDCIDYPVEKVNDNEIHLGLVNRSVFSRKLLVKVVSKNETNPDKRGNEVHPFNVPEFI